MRTLQDGEAWQNECIVHDYVERFCEKWAPMDRRKNAEFHADFLTVVQAIYRDSVRPMHDALTKAFAAMPPMIFPKAK